MIEGVQYSHLLDYLAETYASREAVTCAGRRLSFHCLRERCYRARTALRKQGVGRGSVVLTALGNDPDFIAIFFAVLQLEAVLVPCDTALDASALCARALEVSADVVLMGDKRQVSEAKTLARLFPLVMVNVEEERYPDLFSCEGQVLPADGERPRSEGTGADDVRLVAFTSGSTGSPKGALLTEENLFKPAASLTRRFGLSDADVVLMPLPISHMFGLISGMLMSLLAGARLVLMEKFDPRVALKLIEEERVTVHHAVPTMLTRELVVLEDEGGQRALGALRSGMVAGASVPAALIERAQRQMGCSFVSAYGSTETVNVTCGFPDDPLDVRAKYVGKPSDGVKVRVVDDEGCEVAQGEVGELCVKGPGIMKGYVGLTGKGSSFDKEGWFHTGDMASLSDDGYVAIRGRKKDLIIRAGNNIVPAAIEAVFSEFPDVVEACVLGVPDDDLGERAVLFVSPAEGSVLHEGLLRAFAQGKVPKFAMPDEIVVAASMPRLSSGKIDKIALLSLRDSALG